MKRKLIAILSAALLTVGALGITVPALASTPGPLAVDMCVTINENTYPTTGDQWTLCDLPSNLKNANLTGDTTGLHGGCNGSNTPFTNPDWNDCVSSFNIAGLPANYKVVFYVNSNYGFANRCRNVNGNYNFGGLENDRTSSWRVEGGVC